jgi:hypothetical protein
MGAFVLSSADFLGTSIKVVPNNRVMYTNVGELFLASKEIIDLAEELGVEEVFPIIDKLTFRYCKKGAKIEHLMGETTFNYDVVEVQIPTFDIYNLIRLIMCKYEVCPCLFHLTGLLQYLIIGLESSDMDCSTETIYYKVGAE